jgi:MFS transporter, DHA2 family, multidrug resistance protein
VNDSSETRPPVNPWLVAVAVMFGTFMEVLDTTVVNVSLPHIAGSLSATIEEATWVLTSYLVANAIILPLTGWLGNYFGRKRVLLTTVAGFTISSLLCGLAPSLPLLVFFRVLQGLCGGSMQPLSQAVLLETFPPEKRGAAMGFWGLGIVVAPILGPVLGGWVTDSYSWRWVFYINIPVGIASMIMIQQFIFDPHYIRRGTSRIDYWGIGMLAVAIAALQIALDRGQQDDWFSSRWITSLVVISVVMLAVFIFYELWAPHPVVDLRVFQDRTYGTGTLMMTLLGFGLYGGLVLLPIMLQTLLGYPALQAGMATSPRGIGSFIAMPIVGAIMARFDPRKLLAIGLSVTGMSYFMFAGLNLNAGYWDIFWPQMIQGVSLALVWVPLTTSTMDPIPKEVMGNATSIYNLTRNLGASVGIATVTTLLSRRQQVHLNILSARVNAYDRPPAIFLDGIRSGLTRGGTDLFTATRQSYSVLYGVVQRHAAMLTFVEIYTLLGAVFFVMLPMIWLMRRPARARAVAPVE